MKRILFRVVLLLLAGGLFGCRKEAPATMDPNDTSCSTWLDVFDSFWEGMNYSYAFWDIDPTDWDEVYRTYRPRFAELGEWNGEHLEEARLMLEEITANLIDHHYSLALFDPETGEVACTIRPALNELRQRDYYHEPMPTGQFYDIISSYGATGRVTRLIGGTSAAPISQPLMMVSFLIDDVAYLYFDRFILSELFLVADETDNAIRAWRNFWDMIETTPNLRGILIDVRDNQGGYLADMRELAGRLTAEEHLFGYSRTKSGLGRLDYTPWLPLTLTPTTPGYSAAGDLPVVLLTSLYSISMAELTAMAIRSLPNGHLIGERTYGGTGYIYSNFHIAYAGRFQNEALLVYMTSSMSRDAEGTCLEGIGITPDREALFDAEQFAAGTDTQLEAALDYIRSLEQ